MMQIKKDIVKSSMIFLIVGAVITAVIVFSAPISHGVQRGIMLSLNSLIPSLFVFMVLSSFLMKTGIGKKALFFIIRPLAKLFRVSEQCAAIYCFSLIGGFPIGAKLLADAVNSEEVDRNTAERMLAYCVNCGPAFLISAVSVPIFHNHMIGLIVYCSQIFSSLAVGIVAARGMRRTDCSDHMRKSGLSGSASYHFIHSVESSIRSMAMISALVIVFSALNEVLEEAGVFTILAEQMTIFVSDNKAISFLTGILEVTNGCSALAKDRSFIILIVITGFGGLCVQMQIKAIAARMKMRYFYLYRPMYIAFSLFFSLILIRLFGGTAAVFQHQETIVKKTFIASPAFSVILIILSVFLLLSVRKSGIIKKNCKDDLNGKRGE